MVVGGFLTLLVISELIYSFRNRPQFVQRYYLFLAKQTALVGNIQRSIFFLNKAAQITIDLNAKKYPVYEQVRYPKINYDSSDMEFQKEYKGYVAAIPPFNSDQDTARYIAKIFYDLGLIAYKTDEKNMAVYFLQTAVLLDPYFSYYHVELANYYLAQGDKDQANKVIEFCLNFDVTVDHCNEYQNDNIRINYPEDVGFLKQRVELFVK